MAAAVTLEMSESAGKEGYHHLIKSHVFVSTYEFIPSCLFRYYVEEIQCDDSK